MIYDVLCVTNKVPFSLGLTTYFRHNVTFNNMNCYCLTFHTISLLQIHAKKKSKKGDEERSEEFSRVYELPNELDPSHVTSSIYKDGVLTIELPVSDALGPSK